MGAGLLSTIVAGVQQCVTHEKSKAAMNTFKEQVSLMESKNGLSWKRP